MLTVKGSLLAGVEVDGVVHKDFVMRSATIRDSINAVEKGIAQGEDMNLALVARFYKAAEQLVSLGTLSPNKITGELLLSLEEIDAEPILNAQDEIEKKRKGLKSKSSPISS